MDIRSEPLIVVPGLHQTGIVVRDLEKTALSYFNLLGIGPWDIFTLLAPNIYNTTYHGKPALFGIRVAFAQIGPFELELMTTIEGHTDYDDFLKKQGEGANHLQYWVDDVDVLDAHVKVMTGNDFPPLVYARFGDNGGFAYLDTVSALGTVWEPVKMADRFDGPLERFPNVISEKKTSTIEVREISRVSIVVKNLDKAIENYSRILGIGPWEIELHSTPDVKGYMYRGNEAHFENRTGWAASGDIEIELVQPLSGESSFRDFVGRHGQGIHHIEFKVENIDKTTRLMNKAGFMTLMSGKGERGYFAYYETVEPLKIIWKAVQQCKLLSD